MNSINFNQIGGFPLTTDILAKLQTAFNVFNSLGTLAGDKTIISGCETVGTKVADGVVFVNGEVFEFKGGTAQTKVKIVEAVSDLVFEDANSKPTIKTRIVTFGTGLGAMDWEDFKRPIETKVIPTDIVSRLEILEKKNAVFQAGGGMVLWNKPLAEIPVGWAEVVDWRGRMPVGFDSTQAEFNVMGKEDGHKNKTLSIEEMPEHGHEGGLYNTGEGPILFTGKGLNSGGDKVYSETKKTGGGQEFSILNPYRVVLFIEYIG